MARDHGNLVLFIQGCFKRFPHVFLSVFHGDIIRLCRCVLVYDSGVNYCQSMYEAMVEGFSCHDFGRIGYNPNRNHAALFSCYARDEVGWMRLHDLYIVEGELHITAFLFVQPHTKQHES